MDGDHVRELIAEIGRLPAENAQLRKQVEKRTADLEQSRREGKVSPIHTAS